mmetsp:Transcript_50967/g.129445  ORF Transcript_50967/g.129445 Transcript_50967/m.129445 type:complete len:264 (-) Transcript_50967:114-905(-)
MPDLAASSVAADPPKRSAVVCLGVADRQRPNARGGHRAELAIAPVTVQVWAISTMLPASPTPPWAALAVAEVLSLWRAAVAAAAPRWRTASKACSRASRRRSRNSTAAARMLSPRTAPFEPRTPAPMPRRCPALAGARALRTVAERRRRCPRRELRTPGQTRIAHVTLGTTAAGSARPPGPSPPRHAAPAAVAAAAAAEAWASPAWGPAACRVRTHVPPLGADRGSGAATIAQATGPRTSAELVVLGALQTVGPKQREACMVP